MSAPGDGPLSGARFGVDGPSFFRPQRKYGPVVAPKPKLNPYRPGGGPGASEASTRPEPGPAVSEACTRPEPGPAVSEACTRPEPTLNEAFSRPEPIVIEAYSRPEPGPKVTAVTDRGINRACLGRVGDIPELDLPPPPPPPQEMEDVPPAAAFAPPPPPPPPPFEESFPPPPEDASFPSPPSPLAQDVPQEGGGGSSLELEIDTLSSLIKDMEKGGPQSAKITTSGPRVSAEAGVSSEQARPPPAAQTGPRPAGFAPVKAPKPSVPLPRGRAWPPADPSPRPGPQRAAAGPVSTATKPGPQWAAAGPVSTATKTGPRAAGPGLVGQASQAEAPGRRGEEGIQTGTTVSVGVLSPPPPSRAAAPLPAALSYRDVGRASPAEAPGRRGEEGTQTGTTMSVGVLSPPPPSRAAAPLPAPLSYRDVEELEQLALSLMQEMDKMPGERAGTNEQCAQCGKPLLRSQAAVKAMGRLYHVECFLCSVCHSQLQGQQFYEVDGKPLCETCHQETLEKCSVCKQPITERMLRATGRAFHPACFTCSVCGRALEGQPFIVDPEGAVNCVDDYHRKFAPKCSVCHEPIIPEEGKDETVRIIALEKNFHVKCYRCEDCGVQLSTEADEGGCYPLDGHVLCLKCHTSRVNQGKRD